MTPQGSLRKIGIELDLAKKPVLRNWFTMAAAAKELEPFLLGIEVTHFRRGAETTAVDLTGPPDVLRNFFSRFLSDEDRHVYNLSYGE